MKDETGQIIGRSRPAEAKEDSEAAPTDAPATTTTATDTGTAVVPTAPTRDTSFSFQAVTESAVALAGTCERLQEVLAEARSFTEDGLLSTEVASVDRQVRNTMDATTVQLERVIDHAFKRSAQILLLVFVIAVAYRLVSIRALRMKA
jgi:hypothetical protein